jgi:putative transcriptional regulator
MRNGAITKRIPEKKREEAEAWARLDAMTEEEKHDASLSDPDAQPQTAERLARMKRTPQVKIIRRALGLSQEEFAAHYRIPIGTLRDWEQGRSEPDAPGRAYLRVIAKEPELVRKALDQGIVAESAEAR